MKKNLLLFISFIVFSPITNLNAQSYETIWFDGLARTYFSRDALDKNLMDDTLSTRNISNGYNLLDLNTHVNPIDDIEIFAQIRIRNSLQSFFGSGTEINVRQLNAKGVINKKLRFSVGDLYLKQSKFTLFNSNEDLFEFENDIFKTYRNIIHYENFYEENRWHLHGIQTDFSFAFDRFIRNLDFDFFITRPRGSLQINETNYSSDLLLSGGSMISKINKRLSISTNYINFFEVATSGTKNISLRNPVYDISLKHILKNNKHQLKQKIQSGFSKRYWLHTELENTTLDSISNNTKGMYIEFDNKYMKYDSTLFLTFGYRYVDPNFRSGGAQTRRIENVSTDNKNIYPTYSNMGLIRPTSVFDLLSDYRLYNQELSGVLMDFNPVYSNAFPYGEATPNRNGFFLKTKINNSSNFFFSKINVGFFSEVIGQGTKDKRNFRLIKGMLKINLHQSLNLEKELSITISSQSEFTKRNGDAISSVDLFSHHLNASIKAELVKNYFLKTSIKQLSASGNEFLTQRDNYGNINYFTSIDVDQKDHLISLEMLYHFRRNVYANLQYNWWGMKFTNQDFIDYNYNRLMLILSVEL